MITSQLDTQTYAAGAGVRSLPIKTTLDANCKKICLELKTTITPTAAQPNGRWANERPELAFFWATTFDSSLTPAATDAFVSLLKRNVKQRNFILDQGQSLQEFLQGIDVPMGQTLYTWVETPNIGNGITWILQLTQHIEGTSSGTGGGATFASPSPVATAGGTYTDGSGTIATLNVSQQIFAANTSRRYLFIQNNSDTAMWVNFGTAAVASQPSITIAPGGYYEPAVPPNATVNILCSVATKTFSAKQI